jgi:hypothetical protein
MSPNCFALVALLSWLTCSWTTGTPYLCIMTNNHVIKSADQACRSVAEFFDLSDTSKATRVSLRPDVLFITVHLTPPCVRACMRAVPRLIRMEHTGCGAGLLAGRLQSSPSTQLAEAHPAGRVHAAEGQERRRDPHRSAPERRRKAHEHAESGVHHGLRALLSGRHTARLFRLSRLQELEARRPTQPRFVGGSLEVCVVSPWFLSHFMHGQARRCTTWAH